MSDMDINQSTAQDDNRQSEETTQPVILPGAQLAAKREQLNWSIDDIAKQLNLAPRQIAAIEADNYAALPGMATVRGFIRSYAKLLKLDAAPLLLLIANETGVSEESIPLRRPLSPKPFADNRVLALHRPRSYLKSGMILAIPILLLAGLVVAHQMKWISILPDSVQAGIDKQLASLSQSGKPGDAPTDGEESDPQNTADNTPPIQGTGDSSYATVNLPNAAPNMANESAAVNVVAPVNVPATATIDAAVDTKNMLMLKLREDSWVEVKRSDNSTLIARLVKAGESEAFELTGPLTLTVGNAAGVDATLRGMPVELRAGAKNNVARLILK